MSEILGEVVEKIKSGSVVFEKNDKLYLKSFIINSDVSKIGWGVDPLTLKENVKSFLHRPLVLTENHDHPDLFGDENLDHVLQYQEKFRIGDIVDITDKDGDYFAIIEVTDPTAEEAIKSGNLPTYVSPQIFHPDAANEGAIATGWEGIHIALVEEPAWGPVKARITNQCSGGPTCLTQLKSGSIKCNNCVKKAINNYIVSKNKQGSLSSNINQNQSNGRLVEDNKPDNSKEEISAEKFNEMKNLLEQANAKVTSLEGVNKSLKETNDTNVSDLQKLQLEFRQDKISEILSKATYPNDEARTSAINSFTKSGMNYDEIKGHVAHLVVKSGSNGFRSKIPADEEDNTDKVKSGSAGEDGENTENFGSAYTIYKYGVGA